LRHFLTVRVARVPLSILLLTLSSCSSPPTPKPSTPTPPPAAPIPLTPDAAPEAPTSDSVPMRSPSSTTIVVEGGSSKGGDAGEDIVTIARAEREKRTQAQPPSIVITNDSLVRRPGPKSKPKVAKPLPLPTVGSARPEDREQQEDLWKSRALEIRQRLKEDREKAERLKRLTASMRERFYLAPPQLGRDDTLWQEWGRLQESSSQADKDVKDTEEELEKFMEEGRLAGAEPGWLANGEELLMEKKKAAPLESPQAIEPPEAIEPPVSIPPPGDRR